ncbi:MAG TPA: hypothetical protein VGE74_13755 [Gemmata sp.]
MPIKVSCGSCSASLSAPDSAAGKKVKCPKCQAVLAVPAPEPEWPKFEVVEPEELPPLRKPVRAETGDDAPAKVEREDRPARPKLVARRDDDEDDRPRKRRDYDDEDDDRPRARKRRDYDDDEDDDRPRKRRDYDDYEPRRKGPGGDVKRKRKRKSGGNPLAWLSSGGGFGITVAIVGGLWVLGLGIGLVVPPVFILPVILGWLVSLAGSIWFLIIAFSDDVMQGLMCMFVPIYSLIYLANNWDTCRNSFLVQLGGWIMIFVTIAVAGF